MRKRTRRLALSDGEGAQRTAPQRHPRRSREGDASPTARLESLCATLQEREHSHSREVCAAAVEAERCAGGAGGNARSPASAKSATYSTSLGRMLGRHKNFDAESSC